MPGDISMPRFVRRLGPASTMNMAPSIRVQAYGNEMRFSVCMILAAKRFARQSYQ